MQCDYRPMMRRKRLDFVSIWEKALSNPIPAGYDSSQLFIGFDEQEVIGRL
jgi:hypothetical protein